MFVHSWVAECFFACSCNLRSLTFMRSADISVRRQGSQDVGTLCFSLAAGRFLTIRRWLLRSVSLLRSNHISLNWHASEVKGNFLLYMVACFWFVICLCLAVDTQDVSSNAQSPRDMVNLIIYIHM